MPQPILTPMLALIVWTLVIWIWMYATRLPAMKAAGLMEPGAAQEKSDLDVLPRAVRQIADNYNHLHEQPTIFYALVTYCVLSGGADATNVNLAWAYVALRVVHSLIQCTINFVPARFGVFLLASVVLMILAARCVINALG